MNLVILSGKGGTGKTTVATNLALIMKSNYIDCDVEEPNGFIFLKPKNVVGTEVAVSCPVVDELKCTLCKKCSEVCQFNAMATTKKSVLVFDKLCHSCGACALVCEPGAITFAPRIIGRVEQGEKDGIAVKRGILNIGEHMGVPIIKELLGDMPKDSNILDCPPGTSCNVVNTIEHADYAMLVTEPSVFGLHDLVLAIALLKQRNIPHGVVINKHKEGDTLIHNFLEENDVPLLGTVGYSKEAAVCYSKGEMLIGLPEYKKQFEDIAQRIGGTVKWS